METLTENNVHPLGQLDGCSNTRTGIKFNLLTPDPGMISIDDIASGLAYQSHFNGQTPHFFSVAQHCLLTLHNYLKCTARQDDKLALVLLLHDAAEAYIGDLIKPIKIFLPFFNTVEDRIMKAVAIKYQIEPVAFKSPLVKRWDMLAQEQEFETFYKGSTEFIKEYLQPEDARIEFLATFWDLYTA
ncbi:MAG TPA: hypothetical protein VK172_14855 [Lentimicrobium sp.]|nr:hypothetical protein [Bacteroidales bacterium]HLO92442.1 hypothetical protein [Lentimicrobium sp.]